MSKIHVNRDRQNLGQFSPEEVTAGLASGRFLPTDLAWREGMENWQPLASFVDLPPAEAEATPVVAPGSDLLPPEVPVELTPAWEQEKPLGDRFLETLKAVLLSPVQAFANVADTDQYLKPLTFLLLVGWPSSVVSIIYQALYRMFNPQSNPGLEALGTGGLIAVYGGLAVFMPLFLVLGAFLAAGIYHLVLMLIGGATRSFAVTFRVVCYAQGATSALVVVPLCGGLLQPFWGLYCIVIGLREAHRTTTMNAVMAVLIPILLCCGLALGGAMLIAGAIATAASH